MEIKKIQEKLRKFTKERNWDQFHTPKNISMALSVEVAELIEIFQWSNTDGTKEINDEEIRKNIEEEIADILIYILIFSDKLNLNLSEIVSKKIEKNEDKYPIKKSYGTSKKYTEF